MEQEGQGWLNPRGPLVAASTGSVPCVLMIGSCRGPRSNGSRVSGEAPSTAGSTRGHSLNRCESGRGAFAGCCPKCSTGSHLGHAPAATGHVGARGLPPADLKRERQRQRDPQQAALAEAPERQQLLPVAPPPAAAAPTESAAAALPAEPCPSPRAHGGSHTWIYLHTEYRRDPPDKLGISRRTATVIQNCRHCKAERPIMPCPTCGRAETYNGNPCPDCGDPGRPAPVAHVRRRPRSG